MNVTRRKVIKNLSLSAGLSAGLSCGLTFGAEPARLDVKDPAAAALGYVENVTHLDTKKYPEFVSGSSCENCLQLQGTAGNNYRPCGLFPGKLVSVSGWCKSWTPEM
jgi:High potential iron-sulfur protein